MITTYDQLPYAQQPIGDMAGVGKRADPKRQGELDWFHRMRDWMLPPDHPLEVRLWLVLVRDSGRFKIERGLPSGHRIRIFEGWVPERTRVLDDWQEGPEFWLTYLDAESLWRDKDVALSPLCDTIQILKDPAA